MATLADIDAAAEALMSTFTTHCPEGTLMAATRIDGNVVTYFLYGREGQGDAQILGRIQSAGEGFAAYVGDGVRGGRLAERHETLQHMFDEHLRTTGQNP